MSWNTSKSLLWAGDRKLLGDISYKPLSILIELINEWFDIHNSKAQYGVHQGVNAYGTNLDKQSNVLNSMSEVFKELRVRTHTFFQKGLLLSIASLKSILPYLLNKYNNKFKIEYLITRRFNQDIIEIFFSYIRRMGYTYDHPPFLEFANRLRKYILSNLKIYFSKR